jgi:16S rRNA (adenine1518-N6/adenine1519-N6)-dimethyltransferase
MDYTLKKSLGQHFLKDDNICKQIVETVAAEKAEQLLEVGPGGGAITKYLLKLDAKAFKAVELDEEKIRFLEAAYPAIRGNLIHKSFLDIKPPYEGEFLVVGNFPYNISTQILFKVLEWKEQVPVCIGMFQKEVAQRIASGPGSKVYGIMSVLFQAYYTVEYLFDVPPEAFTPPPKVMSGVIRLRRRETPLEVQSQKIFFTLVKAAFNQRRKTLRNATKSLFPPEVMVEEIFNKRAEQLSLEDFAALTYRMK